MLLYTHTRLMTAMSRIMIADRVSGNSSIELLGNSGSCLLVTMNIRAIQDAAVKIVNTSLVRGGRLSCPLPIMFLGTLIIRLIMISGEVNVVVCPEAYRIDTLRVSDRRYDMVMFSIFFS